MFLEDKKNLILNISELIDGDLHSKFIYKESSETPEYYKLLNFFVELSKREKFVTWIYSLNYNKKDNLFIYAVDPSITEYDTIWIESKYFGFEVYRNKNEMLVIKWNDMEYEVEDVSPRGVIEEGWLLITIYKDDIEEEVQFDIRQEAFGVNRTDEVEFQYDNDIEKLRELGIEFNEDFQNELLQAYDDYSNFIRP
jgi:hypothetical protein